MVIYLGADHRGFSLKEDLRGFLAQLGYTEVVDLSPTHADGDDYPDHAARVAGEIAKNPGGARGVLVCGSGAGVDIVANKFSGVRSVLAVSSDQVLSAREDDDVNVLSLAADHLTPDVAHAILRTFLATSFSNDERHVRRLQKIEAIESSLRTSS